MTIARGTKLVHYDLAKKPDRDEILASMLGRTGNLRAPTMRVGKHVYVGFPKTGFPSLNP